MKKKMDTLPNVPGTYLLLLHLDCPKRIAVGKLGIRNFLKGWYVYVGSAFGPGGLGARLRRHLRPDIKPHWHIDYLRVAAPVKEIWICTTPHRLEHQWAETLQNSSWGCRAVDAFGSSDCRCPSHLFHFKKHPGPAELKKRMEGDLYRITVS